MRKLVIAFVAASAMLALLADCRRDAPLNKPVQGESDSSYIGTRYYFKVPPDFPGLPSNSAADTSTMTYEGIQLGRMLFYDKHLSADGHKACASCHQQQYAFSDGGKALSVNEFGFSKRNAPALQNLAFSPLFFWDGRQSTLADQAQDASQHELGLIAVSFISYLQTDSNYVKLFKKAFGRPGTITEAKIYNALAEFEITLISNNSKYDRVQKGEASFTASELSGDSMFFNEVGDCFHCHASAGGLTSLFTDTLFRNNGLDSAHTIYEFPDPGRGAITGFPGDYGKFKDPTLRNIALSGPYMRNGRFNSLMQVINFYSDSTKNSTTVDPIMLLPNHHNGQGLELTQIQKQQLLDFLNTLTDTVFMGNPAFSDPFKR